VLNSIKAAALSVNRWEIKISVINGVILGKKYSEENEAEFFSDCDIRHRGFAAICI